MKKKMEKKCARFGAAVLTVALTLQGFGALPPVLAADSSTQMSSEEELVYADGSSEVTEREQDFDSNWKFYLGDAANAQNPAFDDSSWRQVTLPHDYSIEQEYSQSMEAESGYLPGGVGWYRKHFTVGDQMKGKEIRIDFGGVYMDSTVWVNGRQVGAHPYGYTPFSFDITNDVKFGEENVITVKVNHQTPSSRFYSGSGIYRSVKLVATDKVHVDLYGTKIKTPSLESQKGGTVTMDITTTVANDSNKAADVVLTHTVFEKDGDAEKNIGTVTTTAKSVAAGASADITAQLGAKNPSLWSVDSPNMYTVRTEVKVGNEVVDTYDTDYGFRYFDFDTNTGFTLNGEKMKLKGVCMHHDQGSLGSEAYYRAIERQVEILKEMGCNAIRVTHNPAADELIEACNKHGILLIEEAFDGWIQAKNGNYNDFARFFNQTIGADNEIMGGDSGMTWAQFDLTAMINRGYNAPSIIMWSMGNEVWEGAGNATEAYATTAQQLINWAVALDDTRKVTIGDNKIKENNNISIKMADALTAADGVVGSNYSSGAQYDTAHNNHSDWAIYGSETASSVNSRGVYNRSADGGRTNDKLLTSYDASKVGWGAYASEAWYAVIQRDFVAGEFVWTGFDYLGEPTHWNGTSGGAQGAWPSPKNSFFGIVDTAGFPKDSYYFYQSQWNDDVNTLHILPAWNKDVVVSGNTVPVVVYSDASAVELFLTPTGGSRQSLGKKTFSQKTTDAGYTYQIYEGEGKSNTEHQNMYLTWNVKFQEGTLEAVAYDASGKVISDTEGRSVVKTTGTAAKLSASADRTEIRADGKDLSYITVDVTDASGNIVPNAEDRVKFSVTGDGVLVGVDNGKQPDHDSFQADNRCAFAGKVLAIVQSTKQAGSFTLTATADGLQSSSVQVKTVSEGSAEKKLEGFYMVKNYYVKTGNKPDLPKKLEARYTDGSKEDVDVKWESISSDQINKSGSFSVKGTIDDETSVTITVNMIDEIGALLNYSAATQIGVAPTLPESRPAVMPDGEILSTSFPVAWESAAEDAFAKEGTVVVKGTSTVFGKKMEVTASIRVQGEATVIGESISGLASSLEENIGNNNPSDNLQSIKDGVTVSGSTDGRWTNWNAAQANTHESDIIFGYDTQQRVGEIVIYFIQDASSATLPAAGTTKIYISETGADGTWTEVNAKESIGSSQGDELNTTPYTYSFEPFMATYMKFHFSDNLGRDGIGNKACTGVTEIEMKTMTASFTVNNTAKLASLSVNGTALTEAQIASGSYKTDTADVTVDAKAADNAALTILPAYHGVIHILLESEDHSVVNVFDIQLPVSKKDLEKQVQEYDGKSLKEGDYTTATWNAYQTALKAAKDVIAKEDATQAEIDDALKAVQNAYKALKKSSGAEGLPYKDVAKNDWFYNHVVNVYERGLMTGLDKDTFGPNQTLVRAQFATILYRMEKEPSVAYSQVFSDVQDKQFYTKAVLWAASKDVKIVTGYTNGNFGPNDQITREQMALMMYRYAQYKGYDTKAREELSKFPDAGLVSDYAKTAVQWCVAKGIISGQGTTVKNLNPQGSTSRAECATIISRFVNEYE